MMITMPDKGLTMLLWHRHVIIESSACVDALSTIRVVCGNGMSSELAGNLMYFSAIDTASSATGMICPYDGGKIID
jgi:hypothetical protein